jgi:calcineurin-like phosphoesterase family protein
MSSYPYLIELRIGSPRWKISDNIKKIRLEFRLSNETQKVPHLSLYGAFEIRPGYDLRHVQAAIESVAQQYNFLPYYVNGWDYRKSNKGGVISYKIEPSIELVSFVRSMTQNLLEITYPKNAWDSHPGETWYHITLAYRLSNHTYNKILKFLEVIEDKSLTETLRKIITQLFFKNANAAKLSIKPLILPVDALRITILHNGLIAAEYDLVTKIWHNRIEAKSGHRYGYTLKDYRIKTGIELTGPTYQNEKDIFVIGDLHLGHANIIRYCCRPFLYSDVAEMDKVLINNWNFMIKPEDTVYFLGDLCHCENPNQFKFFEYYLNRLNGQKIFIKGNHDPDLKILQKILNAQEVFQRNYRGVNFIFTHYPENRPKDFEGWIIYGHEHNNNLKEYPFIDFQNKRINVGVELIKYQPIRLSKIYDLIVTAKENILTLS